MIRRRVQQDQPNKLAQGKRIRGTPGNRTLRVQPFEIPDQQQPEVAPWRQPRPAGVRLESLTESFDIPIEVVLIENLIHPRVERMRGSARKILGGYPHRRVLRAPLSFAHRHRRSVERAIDRVDL
jgi:hypothetical protein